MSAEKKVIMPLRFLIDPTHDDKYGAVRSVLDAAVEQYPDTFDRVEGEPGRVDHYGYHDSLRSSVVLAAEYASRYVRLTIRPGLHPVFDELLKIMVSHHETAEVQS